MRQQKPATDTVSERKVAVLGLGNVLMGDDGLGPYVIKALEASYEFGEGVSVRDIGTPGPDLVQHIVGLEALIVVDTLRATGEPGEMRVYRRDQILKHAPGPRLSPHDPGLKEALLTLDVSDMAPQDVLLIGVIPAEVDMGVGLSPVVQKAVPQVAAEVVRELTRLGMSVRKRPHPRTPDIWWEKSGQGR